LELEDPVIRKLASKIVVDRFNEKYAVLNAKQKELLREYVNSVNNSPALLNKVKEQIPVIINEITELSDTIPSKVLKIKLQEVTNMLGELNSLKNIKDKHVLTMLRYYELIDQLKGAQNVS
jgi:CRISPR/Cas system endoribonuclease Cas6 (RAMP superfamily)